jgi:protein gp37
MTFVNSMSDLFHERVPDDFIREVFDVMGEAHWHTFQILTKRHERLADLGSDLPWHPNTWMGVSIENRRFVKRADHLREIDAAVRFISAEPLLGPLDGRDLEGVHWVIAGGESGPRSPTNPRRVGARSSRSLRCEWNPVLLQAVGRSDTAGWRPRPGRAAARRNAGVPRTSPRLDDAAGARPS